jgi:diguanylate cyclase (GGDEF)-like protein/hemerythrin-like metal-binding protein
MLVAQLDYIYFFYGLVLFLLGSVCVSMDRTGPLPTPWWLLGAFAFTHGTSEWLHLLALSAGDSGWFSFTRTVVVGASFLFLLEFARRTHRIVRGSTLGPWLYALLGGVLFGLALLLGPAQLGSVVRLVVAVPAIFWTTWLFLVVAARNGSAGGRADSRRARRWAAFYFGAYGVAAGLTVPRFPLLPGLWPTDEALHGLTGIPIQFVRALLVSGMALSVWALAVSFDPVGSVLRKKRVLFWVMASSIAALLAGGWLFTDKLGRLHDSEVVEEAEASTSQIYAHLTDEMQGADRSAAALAKLLSRFHLAASAIDPTRLDEVVDSFASQGWVVYVMDPAGRTIATSNRGRPDSFLGINFGQRSYFKEALAGRSGRFLGLGLVSRMPGYYASEPLQHADGRVVAVAVVKRDLVGAQLGLGSVDAWYITTAGGRTQVASRKGEANRQLWSAGPAAAGGVAPSREGLAPVSVLFDHAIAGSEWVYVAGRKLVAVRRAIPGSDWSLVVLKREQSQVADRFLGIVITLLLCSVVLTYFVAMQRQFVTEAHIAGKRREAEGRAREFARQADTDALTGLLNRLGFNGAFSREFERARRYHQPLSVVILDLDHFKRVNDEHGHAAGDKVLAGVARLLESSVRESDVIARWGGEEFVVVAVMTEERGAAQLAEKLRARMAAAEPGPSGAVTGSFGVAELKPGDSIEGLLHRADQALYRAKNGGRNRVESDGASPADALDAAHAAGRGARGAGPGPERPPGTRTYADTGFAPIDRDHVALGAALEAYVKTVTIGDGGEVQRGLEAIIAGAAAHFAHEERLMMEFAYPLRQRHEEVHALFLDDARRFLDELEQNGVTVNFRRWVVGRLFEWFRFHVLAHDLGLGRFLLKAGARDEVAPITRT